MKKRLVEVNILIILLITVGILLLDFKPLSVKSSKTYAEKSEYDYYQKNLQFDQNDLGLNPNLIDISIDLQEENPKLYRYFDIKEPSVEYLKKREKLIAISTRVADLLTSETQLSDHIIILNYLEETSNQIFQEITNNPKIKDGDLDLHLISTVWNKLHEKYNCGNQSAAQAENMIREFYKDSPYIESFDSYDLLNNTTRRLNNLYWST